MAYPHHLPESHIIDSNVCCFRWWRDISRRSPCLKKRLSRSSSTWRKTTRVASTANTSRWSPARWRHCGRTAVRIEVYLIVFDGLVYCGRNENRLVIRRLERKADDASAHHELLTGLDRFISNICDPSVQNQSHVAENINWVFHICRKRRRWALICCKKHLFVTIS